MIVTQSLGVDELANLLGQLAVEALAGSQLSVIGPQDSAIQLTAKGGPDPKSCGADVGCISTAGRKLQVDWVIAIGVGKLGDTYGLDVRALHVAVEGSPPRIFNQSYKEPVTIWPGVIREAIQKVVPASLLAPKRTLLRVVSNVDGAEILLDGTSVGLSPLQKPLEVPPGQHQLEMIKDGHSTAQREVTVTAGQSVDVELSIVPVARGGARSTKTWSYVAGGVGGLALVGATYFQLSAYGVVSDAEAEKAATGSYDRDAAVKDIESRVGTARILGAIGAAAVVGAGVLYLLDSGPARPPADSGSPPPASDDTFASE